MSTFAAKFTQSPAETKRYVLDYSLQLANGESVVTVASNILGDVTTPPFAITGTALLPAVAGIVVGAAFFASGGIDGTVLEVQFLATTSVGQILEDVVQFTLAEKV
jgi:hypothetical protein